jgi:hypothetical protein
MYYDYLCKFESEAQAKSVLYRKEGVVEANGELGIEANEGYDVPNYDMIDIIGAIYKPTGEATVDENGMEVPVMADVGGYHANIRNFSEAPELSAYTVTPTNQYRKWAGD